MLGKLFKYDFKEMGMILIPVYLLYAGIMAAFLVVMMLGTGNFMSEDNEFFNLFFGMISLLAIFSMFALLLIGSLIIVYHFYRKFVSDEAYFTLTLPAKPWEHITSKLLVNIVWQIITWVVFAISVFGILLATGLWDMLLHENLVWSQLQLAWLQLMEELNLSAGNIILGIVYILVSFVTGPLIYFASISVGQMANKHKILASIVAFIIINFLTTFFVGMLGFGTWGSTNLSGTTYLLITTIEAIGTSVIYFLITASFLRNNLNLQ